MNLNKKFLIVFLSIFCGCFFHPNSFTALTKEKDVKVSPKVVKQPQVKAVKCNNCPCSCAIKPNKTGECGQYKNIDGKITPVKK